MTKSLFGYRNQVVDGELSAMSADADYPVSNLKLPGGDRLSSWQTEQGVVTSAAGAGFSIDSGSETTPWRAFLLARTNLSPSAQVRWVVGDRAACVPETPAVSLKVTEDFTAPVTGSYSWTRATTAWRRKADGIWEEISSGLPAIHHLPNGQCVGAVVCRAITNLIRNPRLEGAVAGVSGTAPTNCIIAAGGGLSYEIVQAATMEDGLPALDLRFFGTASGLSSCYIYFETNTGAAAIDTDLLGMAVHARLIAGDTTNITEFRTGVTAYDAGGVAVGAGASFTATTVDNLRLGSQRLTRAWTQGGGGTVAFVRPYFQAIITAAGAVDVTVRLAAPVLHKLSTPTFVSPFPVMPPAGAPASFTRNADVLTYTPATALMSAGEMTYYFRITTLTSGNNTGVPLQVDDGTSNNRIGYRPQANPNPQGDWLVTSAGVNTVDTGIIVSGQPVEVPARHVATLSPAGFKSWNDAGVTQTDADTTVGTLTRIMWAGSNATACLAVEDIRVYAKRLTDNQCASLASTGTTFDNAGVVYSSGYLTKGGDEYQKQVCHVAPQDYAARYARCDIEDTFNADGFIQVPLSFAGPAWVPSVGVAWESAYDPISSERVTETKGGQQHYDPLYRQRAWQIIMDALDQSEMWDSQQPLDAVAATGANVLFIPDRLSVELSREAVYGIMRAQSPVNYAGRSSRLRAWRARITERL